MNRVSDAGDSQCITVNKIGKVFEFMWFHSNKAGLW